MRAQSHVIGAVLMLGLAVVALGALTLGIGGVLESQAASADAERVASTMDEALHGVERTGHYSHRLTFAEGTLRTEERTLRVVNSSGVIIQERSIDALLFEGNDRRVAGLGGAVVRGSGEHAWLVSDPPITSSEQNEVLVVGTTKLAVDHVSISGQGGVTTTLETNVSHQRESLGTGQFQVTIETATPGPFERYFESLNASVERTQFDGDTHESVVASFPGERETYLVVHNLSLEIP